MQQPFLDLEIGAFLDDFHLKIGTFYDSRSHFGEVAGILNARMPDLLKLYNIAHSSIPNPEKYSQPSHRAIFSGHPVGYKYF